MTAVAVASKEVTLSHGKTRYLEAGVGHPVIMLHGASVAGGADDFRPAIDRLASQFRVIVPDIIGWPPGDVVDGLQAFPCMTDFVREFQDALGLKSSHVVGATMGGWIAGLFAYESPNRVDKLVLTGNPGFHGAANARLANFQVPSVEKVRDALRMVAPDMPESELEALTQAKVARMNADGYADAYGNMMKTMSDGENRKRYNLLRRMPHFTMPTLLLLGRGDPSSERGAELQGLCPGSTLHIIESGAHQVHYENTEEFCRVVAEFLA